MTLNKNDYIVCPAPLAAVKLATYSMSIEDYNEIISRGGFIAGGFLRSFYSPIEDKFNDIDIFVNEREDVSVIVQYLTLASLHKALVIAETSNAVTMRIEGSSTTLIQIIKHIAGSPHEILDHFDFTIVKAALISTTKVLLHKRFLPDLREKRITYTGSNDVASSLHRARYLYTKKKYNHPENRSVIRNLAYMAAQMVNTDQMYAYAL